jgi:hypothetical protein
MARLNLRPISLRGDSPAVITPPSPSSEDTRRSGLRFARGCPLRLGVRCRTAPTLSCHGLTVAVSARFPVRGSAKVDRFAFAADEGLMAFIQQRGSLRARSYRMAAAPLSPCRQVPRQRTSEGQAFGLQGFAPFTFGCGYFRTTLSCHGLTVVAHVRSPVRGSTDERVRSTPLRPWVNGLLCERYPQVRHTVPHARATQASSKKLCTNGIGVPCPL